MLLLHPCNTGVCCLLGYLHRYYIHIIVGASGGHALVFWHYGRISQIVTQEVTLSLASGCLPSTLGMGVTTAHLYIQMCIGDGLCISVSLYLSIYRCVQDLSWHFYTNTVFLSTAFLLKDHRWLFHTWYLFHGFYNIFHRFIHWTEFRFFCVFFIFKWTIVMDTLETNPEIHQKYMDREFWEFYNCSQASSLLS